MSKQLSQQQILDELELIVKGLKPDVNDNQYFIAELDWLDKFGAWTKAHCPKWEPEKNDCEDQADWANAAAAEAIRKAYDIQGMGKAFGLLKVAIPPQTEFLGLGERDEFVVHVCNIVRCRDTPWLAFQPTNGLYAPLASFVDNDAVTVLSIRL